MCAQFFDLLERVTKPLDFPFWSCKALENPIFRVKTTDCFSIYGGGFYAGSSADKAYDPTNLISLSQKASQPIIAVSLNYRLDVWGFLSTPEIIAERNTNAGLLDQV
jgi:hypothetical protein